MEDLGHAATRPTTSLRECSVPLQEGRMLPKLERCGRETHAGVGV